MSRGKTFGMAHAAAASNPTNAMSSGLELSLISIVWWLVEL